jgi:hypothetical protein
MRRCPPVIANATFFNRQHRPPTLRALQCGEVVGDARCAACHKPAGVNPSTKKKECKACKVFEMDATVKGLPKFPVYKDKGGKCRVCTKCPYAKGWATCGADGSCARCRAGWWVHEGRCINR